MNTEYDIHEWEGNIRILPPEDRLFVYRQSVWYWKRCECGCDLPLAYREDGEKDIPMTIRIRGPRSCKFPVVVVLSAIGASEDEICNAYGDPTGLESLMQKYMRENPVKKGLLTHQQLTDLMLMSASTAQGSIRDFLVIKDHRDPIVAHRLEMLTPPDGNLIRLWTAAGGTSKN